MTAWRALRIVVVACLFAFLFALSQHATRMREGQTTPGIEWTVGALALLLLAGAFAAEWTGAPLSNLRKDAMWGLGLGGVVAFFSHL